MSLRPSDKCPEIPDRPGSGALAGASLGAHPRERYEPLITGLSAAATLVLAPGHEYAKDELSVVLALVSGGSSQRGRSCCYAIDGAVTSASFMDEQAAVANRDHHVGCDRLKTPCSAKQVFDDIVSGSFNRFTGFGAKHLYILANDADLDACLAVWLLRSARMLQSSVVCERIGKLVELEDRIDRRCGAFPIDPSDPIAKAMAWINEPYVAGRGDPRFQSEPAFMREVLLQVLARIDSYAAGAALEGNIETEYRVEAAGPGWAILHEDSYYARSVACLREQYQAFASLKTRPDGGSTVTLIKTSPDNGFPIQRIEAALIQAEAQERAQNIKNSWGGAAGLFTASPRRGGTKLSKERFIQVVNEVLAQGSPSERQIH